MASSAAKAARRADAQHRLETEVAAVAAQFGVEIPASPRMVADPDLAAIQRIEHQADVLAAIRAATASNGDDLDGMSIHDLRDLAADKGIEGRSGMKKADLIEALRDTE